MSDHRPVGADFSIHFDLYDRSKFEQHVRQLYREVHALDASHERPTIKIDQSFLDLGEVRYQTRLTKKVVIENVGKIACAWRFVPTQPDSPIHPEWLSIEPITGFFLPGEKTEIALTLHIDSRIASSLNLGPHDMSGTLILHTILGQDHFIAISGEYLPSCFGNKLVTLTRLPGTIRTLTSKELRAENHSLNAPTEFMRLVNWLMGSTTIPQDLFLVPAEETMCLDTGEEFPWPPGSENAAPSYAIAQTLLELLDSLMEPVVPPVLHSRCVQTKSRDEAFELLDVLQPPAVNVWITLTAFLHFICQSSSDPSYPEKIADIFTPVLMKDGPEPTAVPISPIKKRRFILQFIA
ncbi:hypothetical protein AGABI1DRAFT_121436 [Agaricus bisporus var. burnettii JB137-S8]|uniref:OCRL-1/2 ASH domain-containing protein n=1 Tax=Agaricus bisporus var. burnettii (strain JB137-S8 / ATCC MYA-4627 / FGSC 10392) TaxID=597362 RepID=K5X562_AGABU|nr:uncharacterized protein AGABI1DRAFT_121436 [Agaricus bisporus var. burnettii JB137-S8]EKM78328.1 hypothetical protein AGABI1DRAFT_121436 [Agaricus bisporus var. burnettii JB137-S8]